MLTIHRHANGMYVHRTKHVVVNIGVTQIEAILLIDPNGSINDLNISYRKVLRPTVGKPHGQFTIDELSNLWDEAFNCTPIHYFDDCRR